MKPRALIPHPTDPTLTLVPLTRGHFAVISAVDAPEVGKWNWHAEEHSNTVYAERKAGGEPRSLHRFVGQLAGLAMTNEVDHVNGNGVDCRRSNLRDATRAQQTYNTRLRRDNSTGFKGVSRDHGKWRARIRIDGRPKYLGSFNSAEEAHAAYVEAAVKARGEFAWH